MMMTLTDISRFNEGMARTIYLMLVAISMTSCAAPMVSTKEELQSLAENEGVVIGSILFVAQKGAENESGWAFLRGRQTGDLEWTVSFGELGSNPFATTYTISAKPGKEEVFIKKLSPGDYNIRRASPAGVLGLSSNQYVSLAIHFKVKPRQTSYIGKLVVNLPDRLMAGSRVRVDIADSQEETVEKLRSEHPSILGNTVKDLADLRTLR